MQAAPVEQHFWAFPESLVSGAWAEKRALAAELRALAELCVTTDAPEGALAEATRLAGAARALLDAQPRRTFLEAYPSLATQADLAPFADRNTLVGRCNPFAPPLVLVTEGDRSVGRVTFGPVYEGAPGCVHGGLLAAAFDQAFGHLQTRLGVTSLTGVLTVRYRAPTPILVEVRFEAWVDQVSGRRHQLRARAQVGERTMAEAEAMFVEIEPARMRDGLASR